MHSRERSVSVASFSTELALLQHGKATSPEPLILGWTVTCGKHLAHVFAAAFPDAQGILVMARPFVMGCASKALASRLATEDYQTSPGLQTTR